MSTHGDKFLDEKHGYGVGRKPEDYIESFESFIKANLNTIPALLVVAQRPRDLTRKQLRELKLALDGAGFSEVKLRTAWCEMTNADIAASILGHIRRAAVRCRVPCITTVAAALAAAAGIAERAEREPQARSLQDYHRGDQLRLGM